MSLEVRDLPVLLALTCAGEAGALQSVLLASHKHPRNVADHFASARSL